MVARRPPSKQRVSDASLASSSCKKPSSRSADRSLRSNTTVGTRRRSRGGQQPKQRGDELEGCDEDAPSDHQSDDLAEDSDGDCLGRDIHAHLRELEHDCAAHNYTSAQREITGQMRSILVDWLVEVAQEYRLSDETLHLCVHYTDRFLSRLPIQRSRLQLVGITCLRLACKFEEASPLAIDEFVYISDGSYTKDEVLRMESMVLAKLNFSLSAATSKAFLKRYQEVAPLDGSMQTNAEAVLRYEYLANFFLELALQETDCLRWLPSMIAASSICLARVCLGVQPHWTTQLEAFSDYDQSAVRACIVELHALHRKAAFSSLRAVVDKYSQKKLLGVAQLTPLETLPRELR